MRLGCRPGLSTTGGGSERLKRPPKVVATALFGDASSQAPVNMTFLRYFLYIVAGALVSSALGGLFACGVATISPEFVSALFGHEAHGSLVRYAAGVGMIWGLFLGTAVMGFSLLLVTLLQVARLLRKKNDAANLT
jgi:hypothetical protein